AQTAPRWAKMIPTARVRPKLNARVRHRFDLISADNSAAKVDQVDKAPAKPVATTGIRKLLVSGSSIAVVKPIAMPAAKEAKTLATKVPTRAGNHCASKERSMPPRNAAAPKARMRISGLAMVNSASRGAEGIAKQIA